jgi:Fe-S cluster biogenesis protein NfuA
MTHYFKSTQFICNYVSFADICIHSKYFMDLLERVEKAIDTVRPYLEADGGNVKIIEITPENIVRLELTGACSSCSMSSMTMKAGIEDAVKRAVPEITAVVAINAMEIVR